MTVSTLEKNSVTRREKRGQSIAAMGLVNREGDKFRVTTPSLRGRQTSYEVWRGEGGKIRCNCLEFEENFAHDPAFRCEHVLAVKFALLQKTSESAVNKPSAEQVTEIITESPESAGGEQKPETAPEMVSENGQSEIEMPASDPLENTKGINEMNNETLEKTAQGGENANAEGASNVVSGNFPTTLRQLRQNVDPNLVKQREGWRDRNGTAHYVDYVEWHTVADILDETAPNWSHAVKDIRQIGDIITVTVAITIGGVTREGIGTGTGESELGIKKAEHDALKRAAVKFGIARELYRKESEAIEREGSVPPQSEGGFPANPVAKSLVDLVTAKQLGMIRAIAREVHVDADAECQSVMQCRTDELSKKAASSFITHLQDLQQGQQVPAQAPLRKVS
jgi:Rad52/22 family double-strand break repair protein